MTPQRHQRTKKDKTFQDLASRHIKPKRYGPVYVLAGEDTYRLEHTVAQIKSDLLGEAGSSFNFHAFEGQQTPIQAVLQQAISFPMLGRCQVIWLRDADACLNDASADKAFQAYCANPADTTTLILSAPKLDGRRRWVRLCQEAGFLFKLDPPSGSELLAWVRSTARRAGLSLPGHLAEILVELVGEDLQALNGEIQKLVIIAEESADPLTQEQLEELIMDQRLGEKFELLNALRQGDPRPALHVLFQQSAWGRGAHSLAPLLMWRIRKLALASGLQFQGLSSDEIARLAGLMPWIWRKQFKPLIDRLGPDGVASALMAAQRCDASLKRSPVPDHLVLERAILHICGSS